MLIPLAAALAAAVWRFGLAVMPEPDTDEPKPTYRQLATTPTLTVLVGLTAAATEAVAVLLALPTSTAAAWLVLSSGGVVLVLCDAVSTWIPARLTHLTSAAMAVAVGAAAVTDARGALRAVVVVGCWWLVMAIIWRVSDLFGFADVRIVPVLVAPVALVGPAAVVGALLGWSVLLLVHGVIVRLATGGVRVFAWTPTWLLGVLLGVAATAGLHLAS